MSNDHRLSLLQTSLASEPYHGGVTALCLRKDDGVREHPEEITIDKDKGVLGDRWIWKTWIHLENGDPDPRIQVSLSNNRIIRQLQIEKKNDYHPGDNIIVDKDLASDEFPVGARFKIGSTVLEVSDVYNDACAKFAGEFGNDVIRWINLPAHKALNLRGIYCRVIESGKVRLGDKLQLL